jgi:hypothetical protein
MKAFRGQPSIFASSQPADRQAELEVKTLSLTFGRTGEYYWTQRRRENESP